MADALSYLTIIGVLLLVGLICTILAGRLKLPSVLLLILMGMVLRMINYQGRPIFDIPQNFILTLGVLTLIMVVYDSASSFKLKEINVLFMKALKLTIFFIILVLFLFTLSAFYMLDIDVYLAVLFATFMAGTSPDAALALMGTTKNKIAEFLELESIVNTPPLVLIPFIVIDLMHSMSDFTVETVVGQFVPFLQQIIIGLGSGLLVGVVVFKVMSRFYEEKVSHIAIVSAALLTYVLAENIGGNGVLAVTTLAVIVGNIYIAHKETLGKFSSTFSAFLQILVFILLGMLIQIDWSVAFVLKSLALFFVFFLIRVLSIHLSFWSEYSIKEKLFMAANAPKGIATAVVIFLLSTYAIPGLPRILDYGLAFILYSILLAAVMMRLSKHFLDVELVQAAPVEVTKPPVSTTTALKPVSKSKAAVKKSRKKSNKAGKKKGKRK